MKAKIGTLGAVEANFKSIKINGSQLVSIMEVPGHVPWNIEAIMGRKELWKILLMAIRPSILMYLLFGYGGKSKKIIEE
jgi:hypothetical protein